MITMERRQELVQATVTLDGERAKVCGARLPYPRVVNIKTGAGFEWSWEAVDRVVTHKNGAFHS